MYRAYLDFNVWVICVSIIHGTFQKRFESFGFICLVDDHLSTYVNLYLAMVVLSFLCYLLRNVWRLQMAPLCVVDGGAS